MSSAPRNADALPAGRSSCSRIYRTPFRFFYSLIWSIGAAIDEAAWPEFDELVRELLISSQVQFPGGGDVHDFYVDLPDKAFKPWKELVPEFVYNQTQSFFSMLVPTVDTIRYLERVAPTDGMHYY